MLKYRLILQNIMKHVGVIAMVSVLLYMPLHASDVELGNGSVLFSEVDLSIPGKNGMDLVISRVYDSQKYLSKAEEEGTLLKFSWAGWMGNGWGSSIANRIIVAECDSVLGITSNVILEHGPSSKVYEWNPDKNYFSSVVPNDFSYIVKENNIYKLKMGNGKECLYEKKFYDESNHQPDHHGSGYYDYYDVEGYYLTEMRDIHGNSIVYEYEEYRDMYWSSRTMYSDDFPHGATWIEDPVSEGHAVRKYADKLSAHLKERANSYTFNTMMFKLEVAQYFYRPSKIIDTNGREITFEYDANVVEVGALDYLSGITLFGNSLGITPDLSASKISNQNTEEYVTLPRLKSIQYTGVYGEESSVLYLYDENGNLYSVEKGAGPHPIYEYTAYEPSFKKYRRYNKTKLLDWETPLIDFNIEWDNVRFESVEFPGSWFTIPDSTWNVHVVDDMARFKGWLLKGVTSPLGSMVSYTYQDAPFRYLTALDQTINEQKTMIDAYSYPVISSKTVRSKNGEFENSYTYTYPEDDEGHPLKTVFKYQDKYTETSIISDIFNKYLILRSALFSWGSTSTYFKHVTVTPEKDTENSKFFEWDKGLMVKQNEGNKEIIKTYDENYLPETMVEIKGNQRVNTYYKAYDEYANILEVQKVNADNTLSTTTTLTYEQDPTLIDNRFYHLVKTKVTADETGQQTPMQTYSYSDTGQVLTITESHNNETRTKVTNTYDNDGRIKTKTTPDQNTVSFTYDDTYSYNGQLAMKTEQSVTAEGGSSASGGATGATTMTTTSILDFYTGAPLVETDANGATTTFAYDSYARPIKTTYADGTTKLTSYSSDLTETTVQENGISVTKKVDSLGRTLWVDNPEGVEDTYYIYTDALKRVAEVQKGTLSGGVLLNGRTVKSYVYDSYGRVTDSHDPNWGTTSIEFKDDAKQQTITDWAGRKTIKHYNDFNQVTQEELYADTNDSITKTYGASSIGLDGYVKDGRDFYHQTEGVPGWYTTIYHPSSSLGNKDEQEELTYRADGSLTERKIIGRNNTYLTYSYDYDSIGRLTDVYLTEDTDSSSYGHTQATSKASNTPKETYTYDENGRGYSVGRLTTSTNDDVEQTYTYDLLGRITNEVTTIKGASTGTFTNGNNQDMTLALSRTFYDDNGQLKTLTYDDDTAITYTYDNLNRLDSIYYKDTLIASYTYTTKGTIDTITYGNNMSQAFGYEKDVLITDITTTHPTNGKQIVETYEYDDKGHIITNRIPAVGYGYASTRNYTYTDRGELESVTQVVVDDPTHEENNGSSSTTTTLLYDYSYDNNGNVLTAKQPSGFGIAQLSLTPDTISDELVSITKTQLTSNGSTTGTPEHISYVYDAAGNMTKKTMGDGDIFLTYNWQQQVKTYHENYGDKLTANYIYNNDRERVYSHTQIPQGGRGNNSQIENKETYYIWDAGQIIGEKNTDGEIYVKYIYSGNEKMAMVRKSSAGNDRIYYFINNAQGTPRVIVDGNGTIQQNQQTDPWGNLEAGVNHKNEVNFTGKKKDRLSGLYYFNQRYYDADAYRFVQKDPAEQYLNPYVYGANNPLSYVDPDGQFFEHILAAVGGGMRSAMYSMLHQFNQNFGYVDMGLVSDAFWGGAASAALFQVIHVTIPDYGIPKIIAHGVVGGYMAGQSGGNVMDGFLTAGLNQAVAPWIDQIDTGQHQSILRVGASAILGAATSAITGENPGLAMLIAGYSRAYNDEASQLDLVAYRLDEFSTAIIAAGLLIPLDGVLIEGTGATIKGVAKVIKHRKAIKKIVMKMSVKGKVNSIEKVKQLERVVTKAGGKVRYDNNGVKGYIKGRPHMHVDGLGARIKSRHIEIKQ